MNARATPDTKSDTLSAFIKEFVHSDAIIYTDENDAYNQIGRSYKRYYVDHSKKLYSYEHITTNRIEGAWTHFKRMVKGTYRTLLKKYLQKYVDEFVYRYNLRASAIQTDLTASSAALIHVIHTSKSENQRLKMKRRKEPTEFKLGTIIVPYMEMFDEAVAIRTEGVQLIIDTYFNDLSINDIPQQYVFTWDWLGKGYKFTVINHLYKSSRAKTKRGFKKLLAEALPLLIAPKSGLIKKRNLVRLI